MAQISSFCFSNADELMSLDDAQMRISKFPIIAPIIRCPLAQTDQRIAAKTIHAIHSVPAFANSAVDGYCVYDQDISSDASILPVVGQSGAGNAFVGIQQPKTAIRIFTGAQIPLSNGAPQCVYMDEDCTPLDGQVQINGKLPSGMNTRPIGDDVAKDTVLIHKGARITPMHVGLMAAQGFDDITIYRPLRIGILSIGTELTTDATQLKNGKIFDSNRAMLIAMLLRQGLDVADLGVIGDDAKLLESTIYGLENIDLLITTAAMSLGIHDHMQKFMTEIAKQQFWRLAIKPGRPVGLGVVENHPSGVDLPILGLPGNPVAAITTLLILGLPLIMRLNGANYVPPQRFSLPILDDYSKKKGRAEYVRASIQVDPELGRGLRKVGKSGAAVISSLALADGLIELPAHSGDIARATLCDFIPFTGFYG